VAQSPGWNGTREQFELLRLVPDSALTERHLMELESAAQSNIEIRECVLQVPRQQPAPEAIAEMAARVRSARG